MSSWKAIGVDAEGNQVSSNTFETQSEADVFAASEAATHGVALINEVVGISETNRAKFVRKVHVSQDTPDYVPANQGVGIVPAEQTFPVNCPDGTWRLTEAECRALAGSIPAEFRGGA